MHSYQKRDFFPEKPNPVILKGKYVRLEPLNIERDAETLFKMSNGSAITLSGRTQASYDADTLIWRYLFEGPFTQLEDFKNYLIPYVNASQGLCLCVFDVLSNQPVGIVNYLNNFPSHLRVELGGIWYSPIVQRTAANTESIYLMLKHAFELGYQRVEWKCDKLNERSCQAALRLGFTFEGVFQKHMIMKGRNRDTSWFRILDDEWPEIKIRLEKLLEQ